MIIGQFGLLDYGYALPNIKWFIWYTLCMVIVFGVFL